LLGTMEPTSTDTTNTKTNTTEAPISITDSLGKLPLAAPVSLAAEKKLAAAKKKQQLAATKTKSSASTKRKAVAMTTKTSPSKTAKKTTSVQKKDPPNHNKMEKQPSSDKKDSASSGVQSPPEKSVDAAPTAAKPKANHEESLSEPPSSNTVEAVACCLCHCGLDCSDRGLFFREDRQRELQEEGQEYYFNSMDDPYLDKELYDRNNALVYCDSCERLYHQKCHFVPLLVVPRGDWECLVCRQEQQDQKNGGSPLYPTKVLATMFTSPPAPNVQALQTKWEWHSRTAKAALWNQQLKQIKSSLLGTQFSNIRQAQATLATLTSTKRNRQHFFSTSSGKNGKPSFSQELAQTILRYTSAQFKIREVLQSLESIRTAPQPGRMEGALNQQWLQHWCQQYPQHAHHVFPYGPELYDSTSRRCIPRTREINGMRQNQAQNKLPLNTIPTEISISVVPTSMPSSTISPDCLDVQKKSQSTIPAAATATTAATANGDKKKKSQPTATATKSQPTTTTSAIATAKATTNGDKNMPLSPERKKKKDDNDSGITLDDLQCCVCFIGDSSDENDVLLCDGQGCYRAFHMKCLQPQVKAEDIANEEEDWFCPLCSAISNMIHDVQCQFMDHDDHDWEERRAKGEDSSSLQSWGHVDQVFPQAEWEYEAALQLKKGKQNEDTQQLLAVYFGQDVVDSQKNGHPRAERVVGSDDEDENDYSLFDENSFQDKRRQKRQPKDGQEEDDHHANDESTRSSQASLVDMSSVELSIGREELAALSDVVDESFDNNSDQETGGDNPKGGGRRKSRRLRHGGHHSSEPTNGDVVLGADFNEANILPGKRRRQMVDYRKLNDALFGELSEKERAQIDDAEDFKADERRPKKRKKRVVVKAKKEESSDDEQEQGGDSQAGDSSSKNDDENSKTDQDSADSDESDVSGSDDQEGSEDESDGQDDNNSGSESEKKESKGKPKPKSTKQKVAAPPPKKTKSASKGTLALKSQAKKKKRK
jgi:hypothetical protein